MPSPRESREALRKLVAEAVETGGSLLLRTQGAPEARRLQLLDAVPSIVEVYGEGSAALAADLYDEQRALSNVTSIYRADPVLTDRVVKIRRGVVWSAEPLFTGDEAAAAGRLAEVISLDSARPYRDTILQNTHRDAEAYGWKRVTKGGCKMCQMLAARGAVYKADTAIFAAHPNCTCVAVPCFGKGVVGEEASVMQYIGSRRNRTPAQRKALRDYLNANY